MNSSGSQYIYTLTHYSVCLYFFIEYTPSNEMPSFQAVINSRMVGGATGMAPTQPPKEGAKIWVAQVNKTRCSLHLSTCVKMPFGLHFNYQYVR